MDSIHVKVYEGHTKYGALTVSASGVEKSDRSSEVKPSRMKFKIKIDGILLHYLLHEVTRCGNCRLSFIKTFSCVPNINTVKFILKPSEMDTIDYNWNEKMTLLAREKCELDHTLSWLSTLGGAFSALGDYFSGMAETAGKISVHQLHLALRMGDPTVAARCRLYFSLSLIQRRRFRAARAIILYEYEKAVKSLVRDQRLVRMCQGIWSKLQYEKKLHKTK